MSPEIRKVKAIGEPISGVSQVLDNGDKEAVTIIKVGTTSNEVVAPDEARYFVALDPNDFRGIRTQVVVEVDGNNLEVDIVGFTSEFSGMALEENKKTSVILKSIIETGMEAHDLETAVIAETNVSEN